MEESPGSCYFERTRRSGGMADAADSKSATRKGVKVRLLSPAPFIPNDLARLPRTSFTCQNPGACYSACGSLRHYGDPLDSSLLRMRRREERASQRHGDRSVSHQFLHRPSTSTPGITRRFANVCCGSRQRTSAKSAAFRASSNQSGRCDCTDTPGPRVGRECCANQART